jgi:hypothetical protein
MGRYLSVCFILVAVFLFWFVNYSETSKIVKDIKNAEKVAFEKEQPEFEKDLKSSKHSQFVLHNNDKEYYVEIDLSSKTMTVKFDTGIIFRKGNTAKLNLSTHKIEFANDDNYNYKVYNFLSGIGGDDMFSIYNSICGVAILCDSTDVFLIKERGIYFVNSDKLYSFKDGKLVKVLTDNFRLTDIQY